MSKVSSFGMAKVWISSAAIHLLSVHHCNYVQFRVLLLLFLEADAAAGG